MAAAALGVPTRACEAKIEDAALRTVLLAPPGPNIERARTWLSEATEILRR